MTTVVSDVYITSSSYNDVVFDVQFESGKGASCTIDPKNQYLINSFASNISFEDAVKIANGLLGALGIKERVKPKVVEIVEGWELS